MNSNSRLGGLVLVLSACLFFTSSPRPAAAADSGPPYLLKVVLDISKSRVLTDVFRQQVERELGEGLQAALGSLGEVTVVLDHPKLADVRSRGLGRALEGWKERSLYKTHFVLIDLVNNQYEIQALQHDGPTGTTGPVVRTDRTPDRAFVARAAAMLIERDFGFTASFPAWPAGETRPQLVRLDFLGAGPDVPLPRWIKQGDIFSVVQMFKGGQAPEVVDWALVQIQDPPRDDAPDAACTGRLFWRLTPPRVGPNHAGYRCVKLGAIRAPLRLRFVQQKKGNTTGRLESPISLSIRRHGFTGEQAGVITGASGIATDYFTTADRPNVEPFDKVAFVTVSGGNKVLASIPVPLVSEQTVVLAVPRTADSDDGATRDLARWQRQVDEAWLVQSSIFEDVQEMAKSGKPRQEIVDRAQAGRKRTMDDWTLLTTDKGDLPQEALARWPDLKRLEQVLERLKEGEKQLGEFVAQQDKILQEEKEPKRVAALAQIGDAVVAEKNAEYERAIQLYEGALEVVKDASVKKHVDKLRADWALKGAAHGDARDFIYKKWPGLDTAGLEREMENARKALEECKSAHDKLSIKKLVLAAQNQVSRMTQERASLKENVIEDDRKSAERIGTVSGELGKLISDAVSFLEKAGENGAGGR